MKDLLYLKKNNPTDDTTNKTKAVDKDTLIEWLKSEFSQTDGDNSETGGNFRDICKKQIEKENKPYTTDPKNVKVPAARLCFLDEKPTDSDGKDKSDAYPKGHLDLWEFDKPGYNGFTSGGGMQKTNYELLDLFKKKNPGSEQDQITEEIFDSGYNQQTDTGSGGQSGIKSLLK